MVSSIPPSRVLRPIKRRCVARVTCFSVSSDLWYVQLFRAFRCAGCYYISRSTTWPTIHCCIFCVSWHIGHAFCSPVGWSSLAIEHEERFRLQRDGRMLPVHDDSKREILPMRSYVQGKLKQMTRTSTACAFTSDPENLGIPTQNAWFVVELDQTTVLLRGPQDDDRARRVLATIINDSDRHTSHINAHWHVRRSR